MTPRPSRLGALWRRIRGGKLTRRRAAGSVAVGLFVGSLPLYGLHFPLCVALCLPLSLDVVTAYVAANVSNPLFAPFLLTAEIQLGSLLLDGHFLAFDVDQARAVGVGGFALQAAVGSLVLGAALALAGALGTLLVVRPEPGARARGEAIARTIARYASAPRPDRVYVATKLRTDPITERLASLTDLGDVVDLATGRGQLALLLVELGSARRVVGFDWDERKIELGRAAAGADAEMKRGDVRTLEVPPADTVLLIDVLHYLRRAEQDALLERSARSLLEGGRLIVRDVDPDAGLRGKLAVWAERLAARTDYNRAASLEFRPPEEISRLLAAEGLEVTSDRDEGPLANTVIIAARARAPRAPADPS